jgi:hypothetical protein
MVHLANICKNWAGNPNSSLAIGSFDQRIGVIMVRLSRAPDAASRFQHEFLQMTRKLLDGAER